MLHCGLGPLPSLSSPQQQAKYRQPGSMQNSTSLPVLVPAGLPPDAPSTFLLAPIKGYKMKRDGYLGPHNTSAFTRL